MKEVLNILARDENLETVQQMLGSMLEKYDCSSKISFLIEVCVEEIFVNIAHYAYAPGEGEAEITAEILEEPRRIRIQFCDQGVPYDPTRKMDADTTLSAEEREIGGLGILMVKKKMDLMEYSYENGSNVLILEKQF